jgi:hypothetical protein
MTRADQGFPPKIEDDAVLEAAAALLADVLADWIEEGGDRARTA